MCDSLGGNRFRKTKDLIFSCLFGVWGIEILWKEGKEKGEREERKTDAFDMELAPLITWFCSQKYPCPIE